jgi:hypothetical protein
MGMTTRVQFTGNAKGGNVFFYFSSAVGCVLGVDGSWQCKEKDRHYAENKNNLHYIK